MLRLSVLFLRRYLCSGCGQWEGRHADGCRYMPLVQECRP